jgi:hypothetical protein
LCPIIQPSDGYCGISLSGGVYIAGTRVLAQFSFLLGVAWRGKTKGRWSPSVSEIG